MHFVLDRSQRARVQKFPRVVAAVVSLALLATALDTRQPAEAAPAADPAPAAQKVSSRPDLVSAVVTARSQGSKVEVESLRTETTTTWANPDGTMTTDAHAAQIRFKTAAGAWEPIDLTLQKGIDGSVAPRGHKLGLRLGKRNGATGQVFAAASAGTGRQVEWVAPWKLPEPSLDGTKATYTEVQPGVDMTMDARRSGFETDFIVKQRPAVAPVWRIPLRTKGLTPRSLPDGSIEFVDAKNVVRSTIPISYMWDSVTDPATREPVNKTTVKVTVEQVSAGKATLVIAPDAKWFLDPSRVFPVTVDPTYANTPVASSFDTFVQSGVTTDLSTTVDLRVGKNGTATERSFLNFPGSSFQGKDVISAHLALMQYGATTCTPTQVNLSAALPASTTTRWTSQPVTSSTVWGSVSAAKGYSSACAADRIYVPMTGLAQYWSGQTDTTVGVALKAANEADANAWKRFYSTEGAADPFISLTWNRAPGKPADPTYTEAVAYAALGTTESWLYSPTLKPNVSTKANDPDLNTVKYIYEFHTTPVNSTSLKGTCTSAVYASGTTAGCRPATDLPDNTPLFVRVKANDGRIDGVWSNFVRIITGTQAPAEPVVSCPAPYANGTWQDTAPAADVVCTVTATGTSYSAPGYLRLTVDGKPVTSNTGVAGQYKITPSSDPAIAKYTVTIPKTTPGLHTITAQAETPAGKISATTTHGFGWGGTALTSPTTNPRITTTSTIRITASGPPKGVSATPTAKVRWRVAGYGGTEDTVGWNEDATELPVVDKGAGGVTVNTLWDTNNAKIDAFLDSNPDTALVQPTTLNDRVPVKLDVQVCFTYSGTPQCTWSQTPETTIQRVPHAFGNGFPTAEAGPGQVALWTGEFNTDSTDISVPGYTGELSISRSHATYAGPANTVNGVFGPGWVANFDGADAGAAGMEVVDSTRIDGTISLLEGDGTGLIFESPNEQRRSTATYAPGTWIPADEDTELDGSKLTITGTSTAPILSLIEDDGTVTTWTPAATPTATTATLFRPTGIAEPGIASKTTYSYDGTGRVSRILAPAPPGVTCPATGTLNPGCRALRFTYTTIGASKVRLSEAWLDIYNPDKTGGAGMDSIKVAVYTYDTNGVLTKVTDPRSNLSTEYGYNAAIHLTSVKPAGQVPFQLNYVTVGPLEKLDTVKRDRPAGDPTGGTATLAKFVYDVPLSGAGLPDLSAASVANWNQKATPTNGYAVFGPDRPITGTPTADDWQYADLQYTDAAGYTINTAKYGAGNWQYTSTDYNEQGNTVRELDERALRLAIDNPAFRGAALDQLASLTVYNADIKNTVGDTVVTPAGTLVTDTYGPARFAALKDGTVKWVRAHSRTTFDEGAPNAGINPDTTLPYRLATKETSWAHDPGTLTDVEMTGQSLTNYGPPVAGDEDGWKTGQAGKTVNDVNLNSAIDTATDIIKVTRYDAEGRAIETRQPESNGSDAGTTKTVYYTAAANTGFPACGVKPQWAGLVCKTYPAAAPTSSAGLTPTLPSTTTSDFTYLLAPKTIVETSGPVTRTNNTVYRPDGRTQTTKTIVTGLPGSTPNTEKTTTYDPATGQATVVTAKAADNSSTNVTTGHDSWGRQTTYQPSGEQTTITVYDAAGSVATVTDANGSTRYTYDGTDAAGKTERRGVATRVDVTTAGSTWSSTGAYDADGSMTIQKLPGGITQYNDLDNVGEPVGLRYTGQVTTLNEDGSTTIEPNGPWLSWSLENDVTGRVAHEWTPNGNAFTADTGGAIGYDRAYIYDNADRLAKVQDRTAATTGVDVTDPAETPGCTTRTYAFDRNDNRLTKSTAAPATDGTCTTTGAAATTRAFDTADRPITGANGIGAYAYDALGRTTTLPSSDALRPTDGNITLAYYDNGLVRSITQGATTTTFILDALNRRATESVTDAGGSSQMVRHYADTSDNPTWVTKGAASTRYAELIGGDLSLTVSEAGSADLTIGNPHGDVVTAVDLPSGSTPATSIGNWNAFDEYGNPVATNDSNTGTVDYGWLGTKQRATTNSGLILMGSRLYNQATGLFTSVDPIEGGGANAYAYPTDPINQFDLNGQAWWRKALKGAAIVGGIAGAIACGASVVCGLAVGAAAAAGAYAARNAGRKSWSWGGFGRATAFGAASGGAWGRGAKFAGWRFEGGSRLTRGWGVRFSHGSARGTDFLRNGSRRFALHSHRIKGRSRAKFVHWHRRAKGGIKRHRPWDRSSTDRRWRDIL